MTSRPFWAIKQNSLSVLGNLKKEVEMKVSLPIQRAPSSVRGERAVGRHCCPPSPLCVVSPTTTCLLS